MAIPRALRRAAGASPTPKFELASPPLTRPRLEFFLPWLFRLSLVFGLGETIAGAGLKDQAFVTAGLLTTGFAAIVLIAQRLVVAGRAISGVWLVAIALCVIAFLGTLVVPGVDEAMSVLPVLAVAILLPYARGRSRRPIVLLAAGSMGLVLLGAVIGQPAPSSGPVDDVFAHAILVAIVGLVVAALVDFWDNTVRSMDALETSVVRHRFLSDERVALGRVLESLEPMATLEATAQAIAEALVTLPGITLGGVLECFDGGLRVLGIAGPPAFPLHPGDQVPEAHATSLITASARGPWASLARPTGSDADAGAGAMIGLEATAYAPMRSGTELIGLVGIGTSDPLLVQHILEDLPAVGEVAATATALLGPGLLAGRESADARGRIEAIIAERSFLPVFQAITTIPGRELVAYEALTRFPDGIRPERHFAAAIAAGLGVELELVTLAAAVRAAERLPEHLWLTLNVSPAVIEAGDRLAKILRRSRHPLVLELTEHVAVADYNGLRSQLKGLEVRFRIAVDDAGAGYASMTHVVELGPSLVKLDISLIRGIDQDPVRQALIAGMLYFSERTDCRLLAEGIETEAELATLAAIGVPLGQGFLLGRPGELAVQPARPSGIPHPMPRIGKRRPGTAKTPEAAETAVR